MPKPVYKRYRAVDLVSLFPPDVLTAFNVLQILYKANPEAPVTAGMLFTNHMISTVDARYVLLKLAHQGIIDSVRSPYAGYVFKSEIAETKTGIDVMKAFKVFLESPSGFTRASDRINAALYDALNVSLKELIE